jgi:alpha-ketoglutaric semialdehyde dehydrogenase
MAARKEELADLMTREMGKPLAETRGDVQEGIDTAYYAATEGRRLFGHTVPSELADKWAMSFRRPIGVCGLITPFNFPMAIPTWKAFPALLAGNAWSSSRPRTCRTRRPCWSRSCSRRACRPR